MALGTWHIGGLYAQGDSCLANRAGMRWVFGYRAGLIFTGSGNPTAFDATDGSTPVIDQMEGCSSVSSYTNGNLLFYTDGVNLWNRNHGYMPFTTANNFLWGDNTSTQSGLILKKPGSESIYYVFTAPGYFGFGPDTVNCNSIDPSFGVPTYTVIDMSLDSGLGDVPAPYSSNSNLPLPIGSSVEVSERLCAAAGPGGGYYWVIYRFKDPLNGPDYLSLKVDSYFPPGGDGTVTSEINTHIMGSCYGQMKVASCGGELAYAAQLGGRYAEILSFNRVNGSIASLASPKVGLIQYASDEMAYGVEFSSNGQVLYVTTTRNTMGNRISRLYQYDLTQNNIPSTEKLVYEKTTPVTPWEDAFGSLQIGPDHRIYVANINLDSLGVIEDPNSLLTLSYPSSLNECDFYDKTILLATGTRSIAGLPNMPNNYYSDCDTCENTDPCLNSNFAFLTTVKKTCVDESDNGQIIAGVINGVGPIEYKLIGSLLGGGTYSTGWQSSGTFTGLGPGNYTILARDRNGCIISRCCLELDCE